MATTYMCPICKTANGCQHGPSKCRANRDAKFLDLIKYGHAISLDGEHVPYETVLKDKPAGDPYKHTKYTCSVNPNDQLVVYVTDLEHPPHDELALVMTDGQKQKISVVLSVDEALKLRDYIQTFIIQSTIRKG